METARPSVKTRRIDEIEGIRGVLSMVVLLGHINHDWVLWFWGCMEIFFAISGYLIGRIAITNRGRNGFWRSYFIRRVLRIWPLYYTVLATCAVATVIDHVWTGGKLGMTADGILRNIFFLQNTEFLVRPHGPVWDITDKYMRPFIPAWSVCMEEHFYLVAPLIAWAFFAWQQRIRTAWSIAIPYFAGVILACSILLRLYGISWWVLPGRLDPFLLGVMLAALDVRSLTDPPLRALIERWLPPVFVLAALATLAFAASYYWPARYVYPLSDEFGYELRHVLGVSLFAVFGTLLVAVCVFQRFALLRRVLCLQPLQFLGRISYSTYLWHLPLILLLRRFEWYETGLPSGLHAPVTLMIVLPLSYLSFRWIETPAMNLKHRFGPGANPQSYTREATMDVR